MPIYDYKCQECEYEFDEFGRINDPPTIQCPKCKKDSVYRLISGTFGSIEKNSQDLFREVIEPEARKIAERIKQGDEEVLADIIGESKMR